MNPGIGFDHPSIHYYDSDYPSLETSVFPENLDETTHYQGLAFDIERYREIAAGTTGEVLELCCGTGRVAIPLARDGHRVTAVDFSPALLKQFVQHLEEQSPELRQKIRIVEQDVTLLSLSKRDFSLAILAFNSLLCILEFELQIRALQAAAAHLQKGGMLVIDAVNPLALKTEGDETPRPFFTRRNTHTGNLYTRFAMIGPFEDGQKQRLYGWYDEIDSDNIVRRKPYSLYWRPIFRYEMELMLRQAGLQIASIEGGHRKEPFTIRSPRMFIQAVKPL